MAGGLNLKQETVRGRGDIEESSHYSGGGQMCGKKKKPDEQVHVRGGEGIKSPDECMR